MAAPETLFSGLPVIRNGRPEHLTLLADINQQTGAVRYTLQHTVTAPARQTERAVLDCTVERDAAESVGRSMVSLTHEIERLVQAGMVVQFRASGGFLRQAWSIDLRYADGTVGATWKVAVKRVEHVQQTTHTLQRTWKTSFRPDDSSATSLLEHLRGYDAETGAEFERQALSERHADMPVDEFVDLIERRPDD